MNKLDEIPKTYNEAVATLARWHGEAQDGDFHAYALRDPDESVVRLVEVSSAFPETGQAIAFPLGASAEFPFRSAVVVISPEEFEAVRRGEMKLPPGWHADGLVQVWPYHG